jgi:hypothetical protein
MCGPPIRTHVHALSERVCVCEREREACTFTSIAQIEARHEIVLGWLVLTGRGWTAADRRNVCAYLAVLCAETKCAFSQNAPKLLSLIVVSVPLCLCVCMSASGVCVCGGVGGWVGVARADLSQHISPLLRVLLYRMADRDATVVRAAWAGLDALTRYAAMPTTTEKMR